MSFYMRRILTLDIGKQSENPEADIETLTRALQSLDGVKTVNFGANGFRHKGIDLRNIVVGSFVIDADKPDEVVTYIESKGYKIVNNGGYDPVKRNNL